MSLDKINSEFLLCTIALGCSQIKQKVLDVLEYIVRKNYTNFKLVSIDDACDDNIPQFKS